MNEAILHHTAVSRKKNNNQFDAVKRYHISKGWGDIGYHIFIEPNGDRKYGRKIGTIGAHAIGQNHKIGICLAGHFDIEHPTEKQLEDLKKTIVEFNITKIDPHRKYANKTCPGKNITDNFIKKLINKTMKLIREKGRRETFAVINGKNYYIRNVATFEDLQSDGHINWEDVEEVNYNIRIDGVIAG